MKLWIWLAGLFLLIGLSGCGDAPATSTPVTSSTPDTAATSVTANTPAGATTPASADTPATTGTGQPAGNATQPPAGSPVFSFMPKQGPGGMILHAAGVNFAPDTTVTIRLGTPDPVGDPLTSAKVDKTGKWTATITVPGTLPSGQAIPNGKIQIVAMDHNNNVLSTQTFKITSTP